MERSPDRQSSAQTSRPWLPVILLLLFGLQCCWFIKTQSFTYDEPTHLIAGLDAWQHHRFEASTDHPPLPRLWCTLLVAGSGQISTKEFSSSFVVTSTTPGPVQLAWRTRPMIVVLGVLLGISVWFVTRALFSEGAANFALALFAFSPELIAHFSMDTTDGAGTLFVFLSAWQIMRWRQKPDRGRTVQLGLCFGGMIMAKFYGVPLAAFGLLAVLLAGAKPLTNVRLWRWKQCCVVAALAFLVVWSGYFFHVSKLQIAHGHMTITHPNRAPIEKDLKWKGSLTLWVPAGEMVDGVRVLTKSVHQGRPGWFLGKLYPKGGTHWYYPIAIVLKWQPIVLLALIAGVFALIRKSARIERSHALLFLFPVVYLVFALTSRYVIGVRHVLPLYPFVLVLTGAAWELLKRHRAALLAAMLLVTLNAADALRYAPGYLSYFTPAVSRDEGWRYLSDSNSDWGQGLLALREYRESESDREFSLAYFGSMDPRLYGIHASPVRPATRVSGMVVVSTTDLSGQVLDDPNTYRWLLQYKPVRIIDHSLNVYAIP